MSPKLLGKPKLEAGWADLKGGTLDPFSNHETIHDTKDIYEVMKKCTLFTLCLPQNHFGGNREGALFSLFQNFRTNFFTITVNSLGIKLLTSTETEK